MHRNDLSIERKLILLSALDIKKKEPAEEAELEFKQIMEKDLNWAEILYQGTTHRTLNMLYHNMEKFGYLNKLEKEYKRLLESQIRYYKGRNEYYLAELNQILNNFKKYNIVAPILKGNLLASLVYPKMELRHFNDLDIFIKLDDVNEVTSALEELEYVQGDPNPETGVIEKASRRVRILHQVSTHELYEFKKIGRNVFAPLLQVDINHNILWQGNCPYSIPGEDLIKRALPVDIAGTTGYMLDYIDNIIQLSAHLYKEATMMLWITDLRDLKIYKFADLFTFIRHFEDKISWNELIARIKHYGVEKIVYYNFYYIELMFGQIIPTEVIEAIRPADTTFLNEYGIENKEPAVWEHDFFTRLFDTNRVLSIEQEKCGIFKEFLKERGKQ